LELLAKHFEPETHGFVENINQHQSARKVW